MNPFAANFSRLLEHRERLRKLNDGLWQEAALFSDPELPAPEEIGGIFEEISGNTGLTGSLSDLAVFCLAYTRMYGGKLEHPFGTDTDPDSSAPKIAYLQNTFSDRAYRIFAGEHSRTHPEHQVSAAYFPGFREVCEEVYYNRCSHAMLPVSSSRDGVLPSFRKLMVRHELKIVAETDVDMGDDSTMRFALLRRGFSGIRARKFTDLTVVLGDDTPLGAFLSACEQLSAVPVTVNSYPMEYADDRWGIHLTLDTSRASAEALYLFLESSHISYETVGYYDLI